MFPMLFGMIPVKALFINTLGNDKVASVIATCYCKCDAHNNCNAVKAVRLDGIVPVSWL